MKDKTKLRICVYSIIIGIIAFLSWLTSSFPKIAVMLAVLAFVAILIIVLVESIVEVLTES